MKKVIIIAVSLVAALCACSKKELTPSAPEKSGEKQIITATVNVPATKLAYSENDPSNKNAGLGSVWEEGDTFKAIQDGTTVVTFTLTSGAGTTSATFQAEAEGVTDGTTWKAVLGNGSTHGSEIHCGFMNQSGKLSALKNFNYVTATGTGLTPAFDFAAGEMLSYVYRVKLPAGIKQIEYTPCAYWKVTSAENNKIHLTSSTDDGTTNCDDFYSNTTTSVITLSSASAAGEYIYIAVPAINHNRHLDKVNSNRQYANTKTGVVLTILNNVSDEATASYGYVFDSDLTDKGGMIKTIDFSAVTLLARPKPSDAITVSCTSVFGCSYSSLKQAVSSMETKWAPYEVGANAIGGAGKYYGFGMCVPYNDEADSFADYYWYRGNPGGGMRYNCLGHKHAKLQDNSDNSTFYTIEGSRYDTARVLWGRAWRMPHAIEARYLYEGTKTVEPVGGQSCVKLIGSDGSVMFIPVLGAKLDSNLKYSDYAVFWTADKNNRTYDGGGWNLAFSIDVVTTDFNHSDNGLDRWEMKNAIPVLPVLASSVIE